MKTIGPREGHNALWLWFELSYAGFLTIPRVLMHAMPDDWQGKMAALLTEDSEAFSNWPDGAGTRVQYTIDNHLAPMPEWLTNYRHPDQDEIDKLRMPHGNRADTKVG